MLELKPFVKWAGGKRQLLPELRKFYPKDYDTYIEPFVGGGAVLFDLQPSNAFIFDLNAELIITYEVIRDTPTKLINSLSKHVKEVKKDPAVYYYEVRGQEPDDKVEVASRFIFLNKTCFNGLYRVNSSGKFNVPFGKRKTFDGVFDQTNIENISNYLNKANVYIECADYKTATAYAGEGSFAYYDPPYYPINITSFTSYVKEPFGHIQQLELSLEFNKIQCYALMSNSNVPFVHNVYANHNIHVVLARRAINSKASSRGLSDIEVIISNNVRVK